MTNLVANKRDILFDKSLSRAVETEVMITCQHENVLW